MNELDKLVAEMKDADLEVVIVMSQKGFKARIEDEIGTYYASGAWTTIEDTIQGIKRMLSEALVIYDERLKEDAK